MRQAVKPLAWAAASSFCDELMGFRVDLEPAGAAAGVRGIPIAGDYLPTPLSSIVPELRDMTPDAALDRLLPALRATAVQARPVAMLAHPLPGGWALTLRAAIVKAPIVPPERTAFAEIAGKRTRWREVVRFGWAGPRFDAHTAAYALLRALDLDRLAL
jgi:hypothetical protein